MGSHIVLVVASFTSNKHTVNRAKVRDVNKHDSECE